MRKQFNLFFIGVLLVVLLSNISLALPTIVVEETELVVVEVDTFDPDEDDEVVVVYSAPLNEEGEWQTDFGDAGNYTTVVTATDGKSLTEEEFLIIVKRKNRAPEIEIEEIIIAQESEKIKLKPKVFDPNGDEVEVKISEPFNQDGEWQTSYDDAGEYTITIKVSDGELETSTIVRITVEDKNRLPEFVVNQEDESFDVDENGELYFEVNASDADGDEIFYLWELDEDIVAWESFYSYAPNYEDSGQHNLKLVVSDGLDQAEKEWTLEVEDVNRPPALPEFDNLVVKEGQKLVLNLPEFDEDGDELIYTVEDPIGNDLEWEISYDEAGKYEVKVEVSDGELKAEEIIEILVEDVDRAPIFNELDGVEISETDELKILLEADDPDGDEVYFLAYGFPEGAYLEENELVWQPDYDFVSKPDNFAVRLLSGLRLDKYFWKKSNLEIDLVACGKELCTNQSFEIVVHDLNRLPELKVVEEITINESDKLRIKPVGSDPDGDVVKFYFTSPLNKKGEWQPSYNDSGNYDVVVGATDGRTSVETTVKLVVNNVNRQPEIGKLKNRDVNEGEEVWIKLDAGDPDNDELTTWLEGAPEGSSYQEEWFSWKPSHDVVSERKGRVSNFISKYSWLNRKISPEKKHFGVNFAVSDGDFVVSKLVDIAVRNLNRAPEIVNATEVSEVYLGEPIIFSVEAIDLDGDELEYEWDFGFMKGGVKDATAVSRRFSTPGEKKIVLTISDGRDSIEKVWNVLVDNKKIIKKAVEQPQLAVPQPAEPTFATYDIDG